MHEKLNGAILFAIIGNALFLLFAVICMIYYKTYTSSVLSDILGAIDYTAEFIGFALLAFADYIIFTTVRGRKPMKLAFSGYILFEAIMMFLELNSYKFKFYAPYSIGLAIFHALVSGVVCFSFLSLEKDNKKLESLVIICTDIILGGMLGKVIGIRIYFSILVNAISFTLFFAGLRWLISRDELYIECHGDNANSVEYKSEFFKD